MKTFLRMSLKVRYVVIFVASTSVVEIPRPSSDYIYSMTTVIKPKRKATNRYHLREPIIQPSPDLLSLKAVWRGHFCSVIFLVTAFISSFRWFELIRTMVDIPTWGLGGDNHHKPIHNIGKSTRKAIINWELKWNWLKRLYDDMMATKLKWKEC